MAQPFQASVFDDHVGRGFESNFCPQFFLFHFITAINNISSASVFEIVDPGHVGLLYWPGFGSIKEGLPDAYLVDLGLHVMAYVFLFPEAA